MKIRSKEIYCLLSIVIPIVIGSLFSSCGISKNSFSPTKKYSLDQVQKDYTLYQRILESHHPGLYWYTSKDSMDQYFHQGQQQLKDAMTEPEFRKVLTYVTSKINCGHTSVRSSKSWSKYSDTVRAGRMFPLSVKVWEDAMVVTTNLTRRDTVLKRGSEILKINGMSKEFIVDSLFEFVSTDGYNTTHKYQTLSNRGLFSALFTTTFGLSDRYTVEFRDSLGNHKTVSIPVFNPGIMDTVRRPFLRPSDTRITQPQPSKRERRQQQENNIRLLKIDTVNRTAMMDLSSFGRGYGLRKFFKISFRALRQNKIGHLIIDVRGNGGGSVNNSTLITRYLANQRFKISDSLYAIRKSSSYDKHIQNHFWNKLFILFFTRKRSDGYHHFGYFERHYFKPKKGNHYDGKAYILTGGNSFSATSLFASALIKQDNVTVVGEETGGGAYGNSAWLIPDVTLPETGVRFRLPLFRLVIDKTIPKNGKGVQPEVFSGPTVEAVRRGADYKLEKVMEMIGEDKKQKR